MISKEIGLGEYSPVIYFENYFESEKYFIDGPTSSCLGGLVFTMLDCCIGWKFRVQSLGGEPKVFYGPSSAKYQLDVVRMKR